MRGPALIIIASMLGGCGTIGEPISAKAERDAIFQYGAACAVPPDFARSAESYASQGFAEVEERCGIFFDKLAQLTQAGRFTHRAVTTTSAATQSIMQAAKAAAESVTIVGQALLITQAVFDAFVEQYAFSPYLYKIQELTGQAF